MKSAAEPGIITGMKADRSEASIRTVLLPHLRGVEGESAVFLSELFIDDFSRRADVVVANGRLAAFEIKSSADRLSRLEGQIQTYRKSFEELTVVCSFKHLEGVRKLASPGVGILAVSHDGKLTQVRRSKYARVTKAAWMQYLPVSELRKLLRKFAIKSSHLSSRKDISVECSKLSYDAIRSFALEYIKLRDKRNADLQRAAHAKAEARKRDEPIEQQRIQDWAEYFSRACLDRPIPRKVD